MSRTARRSPWQSTPAAGTRPARRRTRPAIAAVGPALLLGLLLNTMPAFRPPGGLPAGTAPAGRVSAAPIGSIATYAGGLRDASGGPTTFNMSATSVAPVRPGIVAVADAAHSVVWLVNQSGRPITTYGRTIGAGRAGIVVGNGAGGFGGDGGPATRAMLDVPISLAVDGASNLYIADLGNNRVRKVGAANGVITTVVGNGKSSAGRTSGPATGVSLNPTGVTVDRAGNLYVSDDLYNLVYEVRRGSSTITSVAGNALHGFSGDDGPAVYASLETPAGLAVDRAGNLYFADSGNNRVREVHAGSKVITTVAGNGTPSFSGDGGPAGKATLDVPWDVVVDDAGNLYLTDQDNHRVREVYAGNKVITTVAGNGEEGRNDGSGLHGKAALVNPLGVALDTAGNLYLADTTTVRLLHRRSGTLSTVAGTYNGSSGDGGPAVSAALFQFDAFGPEVDAALVVDGAGNLYIADRVNNQVREVQAGSGLITTVAGTGRAGFSGDGGPATRARLSEPAGLAIDQSGNLFIMDTGNNRAREVHAVTGIITTVAGNGRQGFSGDGGPAGKAELNTFDGLAVDGAGNLFIVDSDNHRIREVHGDSGIITTVAGNGKAGFSGDGGPATKARLFDGLAPFATITVDTAGNLFIADAATYRIREVHVGTGIITTIAGNGHAHFGGDGGPAKKAGLTNPLGMALDGAGNLFVADSDSGRVREIHAGTGIITTVAGNGKQGFSGDGGPARGARLNHPISVAVDRAGNLYIADYNNGRVRVVYGVAVPLQ